MLAASFHWNDVFNVHKWFVSIPRQFFHNHHDAGHAEQRLQPIYLHTDIPEVQTRVSESASMFSHRSHRILGNDCGLTELLTCEIIEFPSGDVSCCYQNTSSVLFSDYLV